MNTYIRGRAVLCPHKYSHQQTTNEQWKLMTSTCSSSHGNALCPIPAYPHNRVARPLPPCIESCRNLPSHPPQPIHLGPKRRHQHSEVFLPPSGIVGCMSGVGG